MGGGGRKVATFPETHDYGLEGERSATACLTIALYTGLMPFTIQVYLYDRRILINAK
jgi:hypothetical protein